MQKLHRFATLKVAIWRLVKPERCRKKQNELVQRLAMTNLRGWSWLVPAGSMRNATSHGRQTVLAVAKRVA